MEDSMTGSQMVKLGNFKDTTKRFAQISEWKTHGCTPSFVQCCGDRVQRTTRLLCETQWWLHDSDSQ